MAKRKVILFLVEGTSELTALVGPFSQYFTDRSRVEGASFYCDVTTVSSFPKNATFAVKRDVRETIRQFVLDQIERKRQYRWEDIDQFFHIVDLDGAFISPDKVIQNDSIDRVTYGPDSIECSNRDSIIERNNVKSTALVKLINTPFLTYKKRSVPYRVFFMSRNLEHALFGIERDLTDEEKERLSQAFALKCEQDASVLSSMLNSPLVRVEGDYVESWEYVQDKENSLKRGTNLGLLLG